VKIYYYFFSYFEEKYVLVLSKQASNDSLIKQLCEKTNKIAVSFYRLEKALWPLNVILFVCFLAYCLLRKLFCGFKSKIERCFMRLASFGLYKLLYRDEILFRFFHFNSYQFSRI
jgi:hypothetical protein